MPDTFEVDADIDTFMRATTQSGMRSAIGISLTQSGSAALAQTGNFTLTLNGTGNATITFPSSSQTVATLAGVETLTNKTLTSAALTTPVIGSAGASFTGSVSGTTVLRAAGTASGTVTIPAGTDTLVTLTGTQTLTNKTFVGPALGAASCTTINSLAISSTGGSLVLDSELRITSGHDIEFVTSAATSVTLPVSGTLYGTGASTITSAQLRSSMTDETGTGSLVFATSPTIASPAFTGTATGVHLTLSGDIGCDEITVASNASCDTVQTNSITPANISVLIDSARVEQQRIVVSADGSATIESALQMITKGSALALTVSNPSSQDGVRMTFISTTAFAHVLTFSGSALQDGVTGGGKTTATFAAFPGASLTVVAYGSSWYVESKNAVTIT